GSARRVVAGEVSRQSDRRRGDDNRCRRTHLQHFTGRTPARRRIADCSSVSARNVGEDAHAHCQALVRASDPDRFVATLFAPADRRAYMFALYAFNLEIARIGEIAHEPLAGEIRLQWWRDALTGVSHGETSGHPVASALLGALESCRLPVQPLLNLIEAR